MPNYTRIYHEGIEKGLVKFTIGVYSIMSLESLVTDNLSLNWAHPTFETWHTKQRANQWPTSRSNHGRVETVDLIPMADILNEMTNHSRPSKVLSGILSPPKGLTVCKSTFVNIHYARLGGGLWVWNLWKFLITIVKLRYINILTR